MTFPPIEKNGDMYYVWKNHLQLEERLHPQKMCQLDSSSPRMSKLFLSIHFRIQILEIIILESQTTISPKSSPQINECWNPQNSTGQKTMRPGEINMETSTTNTTRCSVDSVLRQLDLHHGDVSDICDLWELRGRGAADGDSDGMDRSIAFQGKKMRKSTLEWMVDDCSISTIFVGGCYHLIFNVANWNITIVTR